MLWVNLAVGIPLGALFLYICYLAFDQWLYERREAKRRRAAWRDYVESLVGERVARDRAARYENYIRSWSVTQMDDD